MGNFYSSVAEEAKQFKELSEEEPLQQTPTGTPVSNNGNNPISHKLLGLIDPRSPSQGVSRTPLEIEERNKRIEKTRITNLLNKENNLPQPVCAETVKTPTGPPKETFFDPRSPNPEISRTPISYASNGPMVGRKVFQN